MSSRDPKGGGDPDDIRQSFFKGIPIFLGIATSSSRILGAPPRNDNIKTALQMQDGFFIKLDINFISISLPKNYSTHRSLFSPAS